MRYIVLLLLCAPLIFLALLNLVTVYKLGRISKQKFVGQILFWSVLLVCLVGSFPLYNHLNGRPIFDSHELSLFDIIQTAVIIFMLYAFNNLRRKLEETERRLRDLHQETSILLSDIHNDKKH